MKIILSLFQSQKKTSTRGEKNENINFDVNCNRKYKSKDTGTK